MKRSKIVVAGGGVLAVLGMLLAYIYTAGAEKAASNASPAQGETAEAYVATADLTIGTVWEDLAGLVEKRPIPVALRPPGAITDPAQVKGKTLVRSMGRGEVLTTVQFNQTGAESLKIPNGQRALTLSLPAPQGVADYIQPGAKADIFVTFKGLPGVTNPVDATLTQLLLSNVTVLANRRALPAQALADGAPPPDGGDILLTFAVTVEQAEKIVFAKENGALWLTLMNPEDPPGVGTGRTFRTALA
ncbi:MAG TPA: Flp pilus assembly protein CpaB [Actinomycetota bacterium]|nr:Flp pilus assembly protein CpaB [Actinomycetota bacterium]